MMKEQAPAADFTLANLEQQAAALGFVCESFAAIDSTSDYLKQYVGQAQKRICVADCQTAGRGQVGNGWYSPPGCNLYISFFMPRYTRELTSPISLVIGMSIAQTMQQLLVGAVASTQIKVKWPNDVFFADKKLAGTLVELLPSHVDGYDLLVGCGLNINMQQSDAQKVAKPCTSLALAAKQEFDRDTVAVALLNHVLQDLEFLRAHGFAALQTQWQANDYLLGRKFALQLGDQCVSVTGAGVDKYGRLLATDIAGHTAPYASGKVRL